MIVLAGAVLLSLPAFAEKFHLNAANLVPAANDSGRDSNGNTFINLKTKHLSMHASQTLYVVTARAANSSPDNVGERSQ